VVPEGELQSKMPPKRKSAAKTNASAVTTEFTKLKVAELKKECEQRNLDTSGKKSDLVNRLEEFEKQNGTGVGGKKIKKEEAGVEQKELSVKDKLKALAEEEKQNKKKTFAVDSHCSFYNSAKIIDDFDCMLNQTNIGANNNKFYVIQLFQNGGSYYVWTRWGRVGEPGQNALKGPLGDVNVAIKEFKKKFREKTKNDWDNRADFVPASGKYTLIEMDGQDEADSTEMEEKLALLDSVDGPATSVKTTKPCSLDKPTQSLIKLLFDHDMFKEAMAKMNIDVKKMPLGKLSKVQIAKGFEVLEELETEIKGKKRNAKLQEITSKFYTLIPHNFGRQRPPTIADGEILQKKMDMLTVLGDIEIAQSLQTADVKKEEPTEVPHPLDVNYGLLKCGLTHVNSKEDVYKIIHTYVENTKSSYSSNIKLLDVWEVDRENEDVRFSEHKDLSNRKLLWHGTNVAVVVAILKSGLRIMPHSGGRVGRGIYFASEHAKSAAYVGTVQNTGIMFLSEVALGKQNVITNDDSSLRKPPNGYDSVLAKGRQEPDPSKDTSIKIESNDVIVPQGKPIQDSSLNSSFHQSEYLVYKESQCRIRYLLKFRF